MPYYLRSRQWLMSRKLFALPSFCAGMRASSWACRRCYFTLRRFRFIVKTILFDIVFSSSELLLGIDGKEYVKFFFSQKKKQSSRFIIWMEIFNLICYIWNDRITTNSEKNYFFQTLVKSFCGSYSKVHHSYHACFQTQILALSVNCTRYIGPSL